MIQKLTGRWVGEGKCKEYDNEKMTVENEEKDEEFPRARAALSRIVLALRLS